MSECSVIEIGPGPGGLTRGLLMSGARKVIVIEADERFLPALEDIKTAYPDRLEIVQGDALHISPDSLTAEPYRIISNLPYNIATPLFTGWLENSWQVTYGTTLLSMTCMFQRKLPSALPPPRAQQFRAFIGSGRMVDPGPHFVRCRPSGFRTAAQCHIKHCACGTRATRCAGRPQMLSQVTAAAFGQRRKMLRASLKKICPSPSDILARPILRKPNGPNSWKSRNSARWRD